MTTEYEVRLDRERCEGIFACLVRDERFVEAADGLATVGDADVAAAGSETVAATFDDDRIGEAEQAAAACPVDAIDVTDLAVAEGADE